MFFFIVLLLLIVGQQDGDNWQKRLVIVNFFPLAINNSRTIKKNVRVYFKKFIPPIKSLKKAASTAETSLNKELNRIL
jgi:hypothetical protein